MPTQDSLFIGRDAEQQQFRATLRQKLRQRGEPEIFVIQGNGGMGKTTLARRFVEITATEKPFKDKFQLLWIDWEDADRKFPALKRGRDVDPVGMFQVIRAAASRNKWGKQFKLYQKTVKDQAEADRQVMSAIMARSAETGGEFSLLQAATADVIAGVVRSRVPLPRQSHELVEALAHAGIQITIEQGQRMRGMIENIIRARLKPALVEHFLNPHEQQAIAIARGLERVAAKKPLIVVFDSYETVDRADIWVRDIIRTAGANIIWVLAGRHNLLRSRRFGEAYFKGYEEDFPQTLHGFELARLSAEEIKTYIATVAPDRPLSEVEMQAVLSVTGGIPLAVHEAADVWRSGASLEALVGEKTGATSASQIVQGMTDTYLRHVVADKDRHLLYALALARGDVPVLRAMLVDDEAAKFDLDDLLQNLAREYKSVHAHEARLQDEPERFIRDHLKSEVRRTAPEVERLNRRAVEVLEARLAGWETEMASLEERCADPDWVNIVLDITAHRFWLSSREGWQWLMPRFLEAWAYSRVMLEGLVQVGLEWRDYWKVGEQNLLGQMMVVTSTAIHDQSSPKHNIPEPADTRSLLETLDKLTGFGWFAGDGENERMAILHLRWGQYHLALNELDEARVRLADVTALLPEEGHALRQELAREVEALALIEDQQSEPTVTSETDSMLAQLSKLTPERHLGWYQLGMQRQVTGDFAGAAEAFRAATERNPLHIESQIGLGEALLEMKDATGATSAFQAVLVQQPDHARARIGMGRVYELQQDLAGAQESYEAVESAESRLYLAALQVKQGNTALAFASYAAAQTEQPNNPAVYIGLGNLHRQCDEPTRAIEAYQRAARCAPNALEPQLGLGELYQSVGLPESAREAFLKAADLTDDRSTRCHIATQLGDACAAQGALREAIEHFEHALAIGEDSADDLVAPHLGLARVQQKTGNFEEARALFEQAYKLDRSDFPYTELGNVYCEVGDYQAATDAFQRALSRDRRDDAALLGLATVDLELANPYRAWNRLQLFLKRNPRHVDGLQIAARALVKLGKHIAAGNKFETALSTMAPNDPRRPALLAELGEAHRLSAIRSEARDAFQQALELDAACAAAHFGMAELHREANDLDVARDCYERATHCAPRFAPAYSGLGKVAFSQGDLHTAKESFQRALVTTSMTPYDKTVIQSFIGLADVHHAKQEFAAARDAYEQAREHGANGSLPYHRLVETYARLGESKKALELFKRSPVAPPVAEASTTYLAVGDAHLETKAYIQAINAYQRAIELDGQNVAAMLGLGEAYLMQGEREGALVCYESAETTFTNVLNQLNTYNRRPAHKESRLATAYAGLARAEQQLGKRDAAVGNYSFALEINAELAMAHRGLGELHAADGNYEVAIPAFEKSLAITPNQPVTLVQLADAWRALDEHVQAVAIYERAIQFDPEPTEPYVGLGQSHLILEDGAAALAAFQTALVGENGRIEEAESAEIYLGIADSYALLSEPEAARTAYEQAAALDGSDRFPYTRMGHAYLATGMYAAAVHAFEQAARQDEQDAQALHGQGRAYFAMGRKNDALVAYEEAIAYDDSDAVSRQQLADVYAARNDVDDAIESYQRAVELDPMQTAAWLGLGMVQQREGEREAAQHAFEQVVLLDPTNAEAQQALGESYLKAGRLEEAQFSLRIASEQRPNSYEIWRMWAQTLSGTDQWADAATAYERALKLNGEDTQAWIGLGQARLQLREPQKALHALDMARKQYKGTSFPYLLLAETYQKLGRNSEATEVYEHVMTYEPSARALLGLAQMMVAQGQKDSARDYYMQVIAEDPTSSSAYCGLAELDVEAQDFAAARANFEQAIAHGERTAAAFMGLGEAAFALNELEVALDAYRQSAEIEPNDPHTHDQIGQVLAKQERWEEAQHAFEQTLAIVDNHADAQFGLARTLWRQNRLDEARPVFERSAELNPNHLPTIVGLGRIYLVQKEWRKAKSAFVDALALPPTDANLIALAKAGLGDIAHYQRRYESALNWYSEARRLDKAVVDPCKLGDALFHCGKIDEARHQYELAIKRNTYNVQANIGIGRTYVALGEDKRAETAFQWAIGLDPTQAAPYLPLGKLLAQRGELDKAREKIDRAAELEPDTPDVYVTRGDIHARLGSADAAIAAYDEATARDARCVAAYLGKARVLMSLGQHGDARMVFGQVTVLDEGNVEAWRGLGAAQLAIGDFAGSETAYRMAAQHDSADLESLLGLGSARMRQRRFTEAISALTRACELAPDDLTAHLALGTAYVANLEPENGLSAYERATRLDSESADAHSGYGTAMLALHQYEEARVAFERAVELEPQLASAHCGLGDVALLQGDEAADGHYQQALAIAPDDACALRGMGDFQLKSGQPEAALHHYEAALALDEQLFGALKGAGFASLMTNAIEEAIAYFEPAVQRKQDDIELVVALGEAYEATRDGKRALDMYQLADYLQPRDPVIVTLIGNAYRLLHEWRMAEDRYRVAIERDDQIVAARVGLGQVYLELGRFFEGKFEFDRALRLDPESADVHCGLGDFERRMSRQPEAIRHYDRALRLDPDYAPAYAGLAQAQLELGEHGDAVNNFQRAVERDPYFAPAYAGLADTLKQVGQYEEAADVYQQVLDFSPNDYYSLVSLIGVLRRLGQTDEIASYIDRARKLSIHQSPYNLACFASICGNADEALAQLRLALQMNSTSWEQVSADSDLDFIRNEPEYARLQERYGS